MNITLVAFQDEKRDRDGDCVHAASVRILYPTCTEEASINYAGLLLEAEEKGHYEWEITVLLDGREADSDLELDLVSQIENFGQSAHSEAVKRRREEEKREAEARRRRQIKADEEARARRERAERDEYERLRKKFEP